MVCFGVKINQFSKIKYSKIIIMVKNKSVYEKK
jgi:hypothetical protein